jgi:nuclear transport factor 2 (NTF2) superfamily protein
MAGPKVLGLPTSKLNILDALRKELWAFTETRIAVRGLSTGGYERGGWTNNTDF